MALTKITSTNIGANAVANSIGYTPVNKAGDSITGGGYLDFVSSSSRSIVGIRGTGFGYDQTSYEVLQVGRGTSSESVAIAVDPSAVSGGSFTGNGKEVCFPNAVSFITPNSGGTDWLAPMRIDSAGRITTPLRPAFDAYGTVGNLSVTTEIPIPLNSTTYNIGSHYSTSTYRFTAPVAGLYFFRAQTYKQASGNASRLRLYKNAADARVYQYISASDTYTHSITGIISLSAGDYVTCNFNSDGAGTNIYLADNHTNFSGCLLG